MLETEENSAVEDKNNNAAQQRAMDTDEEKVHEGLDEIIRLPGNDKLRQAKRIYFYKDSKKPIRKKNKPNQPTPRSRPNDIVKLAVHPSRFRSLDALLNELTEKMPDLSRGVRSVFTPKGRDQLTSLNDLRHEGHYVCSEWPNKAHGIQGDILINGGELPPVVPPWNYRSQHGGNTNRNNTAPLGEVRRTKPIHQRWNNAPASVPESESEQMKEIRRQLKPTNPPYGYYRNPRPILPGLPKHPDNKKVTIRWNGDAHRKHLVFVKRKTFKTFGHFLQELSEVIMKPVRRLFTLEGVMLESIDEIFSGPDTFVAAGYEKFRPKAAWGVEPVLKDPMLPNGHVKTKAIVKSTPRLNRGIWRVQVTTSDLEPDSGTSSNVFMTVYGKFRTSTILPLSKPLPSNEDGEIAHRSLDPIMMFGSGQTSQFEIHIGNIGSILKIRMHHDNSGSSPDWLLGTVFMDNLDSGEHLEFSFNRWLSRTKNAAGDICSEMPATHSNSSGFVLPLLKYRLTVTTGDCWNAGTLATVFICLYGEHGDTGSRQLLKPVQNNSRTFQKGNADVFEIEAVSVGRLKRLLIGHDGIQAGAGWFLDKVIVRASAVDNDESERHQNKNTEYYEVVFPCARWIDIGEEDRKTTVELRPQDDFRHSQMEKEMWQYEKWKFQKGNHIQLFSCSTNRYVKIDNINATVTAKGDIKDPDCVLTVVPTEKPDIIQLHSSSNKAHLFCMKGHQLGGDSVRSNNQGMSSQFRIRIQPDRSVVIETMVKLNHHLTVSSMNDSAAGSIRESSGPVAHPDKAFTVYCKGMWRDGAVICFCTSLIQTLAVTHDNMLTGTGKRNRTAQFIVHTVIRDGVSLVMFESLVFPNQFIRMRSSYCDVKGIGDRDCLFKLSKYKEKSYVTVQSFDNKGLFIGMNPDGSVKPTTDVGDGSVRLVPEIVKFGKPKPKTPKPPPIEDKEPSIDPITQQISLDEENNPSILLSQDSDDKDYYTEGDWKVFVHSKESAKNCDIVLFVYGEEGNSGPVFLGKADDKNHSLFQPGKVDEFKINILILSNIYKIRLETLPIESEKSPYWKVKEVVLENMVTDDRIVFSFNDRVFSRTEADDHELSRESVVLVSQQPTDPQQQEQMPPLVKYKLWLVTALDTVPRRNPEDVIPSVCLYGEYGDSGSRQFYSTESDWTQFFQKGMTDEMEIECVYLGELYNCRLSLKYPTRPNQNSSNQNRAQQSETEGDWLCEKVVVEDPLTMTQVVFPANKWLSRIQIDTTEPLQDENEQKHTVLLQPDYNSQHDEKHDMYNEAKDLIEEITEKAANHLERFHQLQSKPALHNEE